MLSNESNFHVEGQDRLEHLSFSSVTLPTQFDPGEFFSYSLTTGLTS